MKGNREFETQILVKFKFGKREKPKKTPKNSDSVHHSDRFKLQITIVVTYSHIQSSCRYRQVLKRGLNFLQSYCKTELSSHRSNDYYKPEPNEKTMSP